MSGSSIRSRIKAIVILCWCLSALAPLGVKASALGISGSFGQARLTLIAGESFRDDSLKVTLFNPNKVDLTLKLSGQGPSGTHFTFDEDLVTLKAESSLTFPVRFELSDLIAAGTYPISVTATIVSSLSGIRVSGFVSLAASLTVMGEAGHLKVKVLDVYGQPFDAALSIVRIDASGQKAPCASVSSGSFDGRLPIGTYQISALVKDVVVAEETIELQDQEELDLVLIARPISFPVFLAAPIFDSKGNLRSAGLAYTITNLGPDEPEVHLIVTILKEAKFLEEQDLMTLPILSPGTLNGKLTVLPENGFRGGHYEFSIRLLSKDGVLLAQSQPQAFNVKTIQPVDWAKGLWLLPGLLGLFWKMTRKKRPS